MSLTGAAFWDPERGGVMPTAKGRECFYCEERIRQDPAWLWHGPSGTVVFHPGCAADFAVRIFADVLEWQRRTGVRFGKAGK